MEKLYTTEKDIYHKKGYEDTSEYDEYEGYDQYEQQDEDDMIIDERPSCADNCPFKRCAGCEVLDGITKKTIVNKKINKSRFTQLLSYVIMIVLAVLIFYYLGSFFFPEQTSDAMDAIYSWFANDSGISQVISRSVDSVNKVIEGLSGGGVILPFNGFIY